MILGLFISIKDLKMVLLNLNLVRLSIKKKVVDSRVHL